MKNNLEKGYFRFNYAQKSDSLNFLTKNSHEKPSFSSKIIKTEPSSIKTPPLPKKKFSIFDSLTPLEIPLKKTFRKPLFNSFGAEISAKTRTFLYHEKKKKTVLSVSNPQNPVNFSREKLKISSTYKSSLGPARNFDSIKYKLLLASNFEKMTSNYFYKENEEMQDFVQTMKVEGSVSSFSFILTKQYIEFYYKRGFLGKNQRNSIEIH